MANKESNEALQAAANTSYGEVMVIINKAVTGAKALMQSVEKLEPLLHDACLACLKHYEAHGDARPADQLIKKLPDHRFLQSIRYEMVFWFRSNSPIRWDAKGNLKVLKEGDPDYAPLNVEHAEIEPFFEMEKVQEARENEAKTKERTLQPVTFDNFKKRVYGLRTWFKSAQ